MKVSVFIGTSLDGFIAREDGGIDWLPTDVSPDEYGYTKFIASVDVLVMGRNSFEKVLTFGEWPYGECRTVVLSTSSVTIPEELNATVESSSLAPADLVEYLQANGATHAYIDGGNTIQRFLRAGKVDQLTVTRIPVLLGAGIPLFGSLEDEIPLRHVETKSLSGGLVQSIYETT